MPFKDNFYPYTLTVPSSNMERIEQLVMKICRLYANWTGEAYKRDPDAYYADCIRHLSTTSDSDESALVQLHKNGAISGFRFGNLSIRIIKQENDISHVIVGDESNRGQSYLWLPAEY